eukprot:3750537-Amphidinium_carterae.1
MFGKLCKPSLQPPASPMTAMVYFFPLAARWCSTSPHFTCLRVLHRPSTPAEAGVRCQHGSLEEALPTAIYAVIGYNSC